MKIYLAARYSRHPEMRVVREHLERMGHTVTSRWIDQHGGDVLESFVAERLNDDPEHCATYAKADLDDLQAAEIVVSFTSVDGGGKGGRHWEMGWAHAAGKRLVLIGPREHVFHTLPEVEAYDGVEAFLTAVGERIVAADDHAKVLRYAAAALPLQGPIAAAMQVGADAIIENDALRQALAALLEEGSSHATHEVAVRRALALLGRGGGS